jgi:hypothetical protein
MSRLELESNHTWPLLEVYPILSNFKVRGEHSLELGSEVTEGGLGRRRRYQSLQGIEIRPCRTRGLFEAPADLQQILDLGDMMSGPQWDAQHLSEEGMATLLTQEWSVTPASNRSCLSLNGSIIAWSRTEGGEGGNHPSNVVHQPYAERPWTINGDTPVPFGMDLLGHRWELPERKRYPYQSFPRSTGCFNHKLGVS